MEVKLLSLNVWGHMVVGGPDIPSRLAALATVVKDSRCDVLLVQELFQMQVGSMSFTSHADAFAVALAKEAGLIHHSKLSATRPKFFGQSSGLAVFSRHPIVDEHHAVYSSTSEWLNNKGFLRCRLRLPTGSCLNVVNTQLDTASPYHKRLQYSELVAYVKALQDGSDGRPTIVGGDFGISQQAGGGKRAYASLRKAFKSVGLRDCFGDKDVVTHPADGVAYDHMFVAEAASVADSHVVSTRGFSDHDGILVGVPVV